MDQDPLDKLRASLHAAFQKPATPTRRTLIYEVPLAGYHPTGSAIHYRDGNVLPKPASLGIATYEGNKGYFLLYFDASKGLLTDTYHENLEGAFAQAEFEFGVSRSQWHSGPDSEPSDTRTDPVE